MLSTAGLVKAWWSVTKSLDREPLAVYIEGMTNTRTAAAASMATGFRNMATRMETARERFIATAMERGGLTADQAITALDAFRKARLIKLDAVGGTYVVRHGACWDREVLRRAAGLES